MKVEISIDTYGGQKQIVDARCTDTSFRRFDPLLNGPNLPDVAAISQRICSECQLAIGQASVLALENVSNWLPPKNARLLRNLTLGTNFLQSHILHFYLLAALDYVTGPALSPWTSTWKADMRPGLDGVTANLPAALGARRRIHEMGDVFGGKKSDTNTFIPGGIRVIPTSQQIDSYRQHLSALTQFIESRYLPDVQRIGTAYRDYFKIGTGCQNLMTYGAFELDDANSSLLFKGGYTENGSPNVKSSVTSKDIGESVKYSSPAHETNNLRPIDDRSPPIYPKGYASPWLRALHLHGKAFEGGPLARMWINGDYQRTISVMDRHVARALEAAKIATAMSEWLDELIPGQNAYDDSFLQHSGCGIGSSEAPCGALGFWVKIKKGRISHYQLITPTCWNDAYSRHGNDVPGSIEEVLIGTAIDNPEQPMEVLRIIHSYEACSSCAIHIIRPDKKPMVLQA